MIVELSDLKKALDENQLIPFFQPLMGLHTGRLTGFEVLARWRHPELGPILPQNLIALAENNGLIGMVMTQVFQQAFAIAPSLPAPLTLSVNVSPVQLSDLSLMKEIRALADGAAFPLNQLTIEITETVLHTDLKRAKLIAGELKEMGCKLALDDFGTGYSSMAHLQALPFTELKVDRSFVSAMLRTRDSRKIVASIIGLAHSLGLVTVAEGVETEEQAEMLLWLGCEQGQGWLYGRPQPETEIAGIVAAPPRPMPQRATSPGDSWATSSLEALPTLRLAQLQAIYDGAPVGLCFLDNNTRYISLNQRLADMNGIPVVAHMGKSVLEVLPNIFALVKDYLTRSLAGEAILDAEVLIPASTPREIARTYRMSYQPAFDENDEVVGISIAALDVTENKLLAEQVRDKEILQAKPVEQAVAVPWIMDSEGNNLNVSATWVRAENSSKERARNLGWLEAVHPEDLARTMRSMRQALSTNEALDIEYRVQGLDGQWRWMRSQGCPRLGPDDRVLRWYGTVQDIDLVKREQEHDQAAVAEKRVMDDNQILTESC